MMHQPHTHTPQLLIDSSWRVGIVHASFYPEETAFLVAGAHTALLQAGLSADAITEYPAPGSFEVPLIGAALAEKKAVDALIGIGIIVEGETQHARLLAEQTARGIMDVQLHYGVPFAFEILYVHDLAQARARAEGEGNKGAEAAYAVLQTLAELKRVRA